jgi:hypothetical protein
LSWFDAKNCRVWLLFSVFALRRLLSLKRLPATIRLKRSRLQ